MKLARRLAWVLLALPGMVAAQAASRPADGGLVFASATASHGFTLVELPPESTLAAPRRPRHALRMRSDLAESAVRSLGFDAAECAVLFRMHSRLVTSGSSTAVVLKPQMHLDCRF